MGNEIIHAGNLMTCICEEEEWHPISVTPLPVQVWISNSHFPDDHWLWDN